ncbi:MAG: ABC transporter ATP-binding protein [Lachnospiraceae bacterium]|nr:ABC transporter ATP-binding protein [Lachnospiraceae bacterium]
MILEARNISQSYEGEAVISNISIQLKAGEIVCLIGTSGVGKTTLFHVLAGLTRPDEGQVLLENGEITGQAGKISYMLQKDLLLPYRTIEDNISLPLLIQGNSKKQARKQMEEYYSIFGLEGTAKKYPFQLSGGMRQRAALLRTYMFSQKVALLDEPFSALDAITKRQMHQWYLDIMKKIQLSTIFISHDMDEAIMLSDRIYVMAGKPGRIVGELSIDHLGMKMDDFSFSDRFKEYKKELLRLLQ